MDMDIILLVTVLTLLGLGLIMVTSASSEVSSQGNPLYYMARHLIYIFVGLLFFIVTMTVPMHIWEKWSWFLLFLSVVLLMIVLISGIGHKVNGSTRWINLKIFNFQPSEIVKVFIVIYLAGYLVRQKIALRDRWIGLLKPFIVLLPIIILLLIEPDFGVTVVIISTMVGTIFLGGVNAFRFTLMICIVLFTIFILAQTQPYRVERLVSFRDPWAHQFDSGYQLTQALIAFGRGGWTGVGLGNSVQKQFYLPEAHTDFVFSILAEEFGLLGSILTIMLFTLLCMRSMYIGFTAERIGKYFASYTAYGLSLLWIVQITVNIGVNVGLLPTKGLTLPFLSYGGSSLVVCCISAGILFRVDWENRKELVDMQYKFRSK